MTDVMVVGLDIGGTSTRAAVVSTAGTVLGSGRAGGGNPTSHGAQRAAEQLHAALERALAGLDPGTVRAGTIGLAGAGRLLADPAARAAFDAAWRDVGLRCAYQVHNDALVAHASGTCTPDGTVLIAGTGAIAVEVRGLAPDRTADGHGWLLGDVGSGFWLGREAVRHTLAELDSWSTPDPPGPADPLGPLGTAVLIELLGSARIADRPRETADTLVQAVTRRPPVELAALAPLVIGAERAGDGSAEAIIKAAAGHLAESVRRIRPAGSLTPIVLGGGLLTSATPLADAVRRALGTHWPNAPLLTAGDGAVAAAWLAARTLPEVHDPANLHRRLLGGTADQPGC